MRIFNEMYVIGIDHGYGNMKVANGCFPTGLMKSDAEPTFVSDLLVWNGKYYSIGVGHKEFTADKFTDDDYYVLTLAAIARELRRERITDAAVFIAAGLPLQYKQEDIKLSGHVIECRINAEEPKNNFRPCPGKIKSIHMPGGVGVRIDTAVYQGYEIPPYYDSMIAKVLVKGEDRKEAIQKMKVALSEFLIEGINTNIDFQLNLLRDEDVESGNFDIGFLNRKDLTNY